MGRKYNKSNVNKNDVINRYRKSLRSIPEAFSVEKHLLRNDTLEMEKEWMHLVCIDNCTVISLCYEHVHFSR